MISEMLIILIVAFIVFGPKKLPMLAAHLGWLIKTFNQLKIQAAAVWQQQLNQIKLYEHQRKAKKADEHYTTE